MHFSLVTLFILTDLWIRHPFPFYFQLKAFFCAAINYECDKKKISNTKEKLLMFHDSFSRSNSFAYKITLLFNFHLISKWMAHSQIAVFCFRLILLFSTSCLRILNASNIISCKGCSERMSDYFWISDPF